MTKILPITVESNERARFHKAIPLKYHDIEGYLLNKMLKIFTFATVEVGEERYAHSVGT